VTGPIGVNKQAPRLVGSFKGNAGFWFVFTAHPSVHIEICAGGCNAGDRQKNKQDVELFFAGVLKSCLPPADIEKASAAFWVLLRAVTSGELPGLFGVASEFRAGRAVWA
jgi:hypothetical protein